MGNMCKFYENQELEIISFLPSGKRNSTEEGYLKNEFAEIKEFRKRILNMNIFKRKKIAKKKYRKYIKNNKNKVFNIKDETIEKREEIKAQYIQIVCMLLIDNTNKNIVKLYLGFIKNIPIFIKENNLRPFEIEVKKYSIIFSVDEMDKIEKNIKNNNQKSIFLEFLNYISNIDFNNNSNISKFYQDCDEKLNSLFLFNTPIEFNNEELVYYKHYYI